MTGVVDSEARQSAAVALAQIAAHEKLCSERMGEIRTFHSEIRKDARQTLVSVIAVLLTIVGYLILRALGWV